MIDSNDSQQDPRKTVPKRISVRTEKKRQKGNNTAQKVADRNKLFSFLCLSVLFILFQFLFSFIMVFSFNITEVLLDF